jgi:cell division inhibitor SulA/protein ImuA
LQKTRNCINIQFLVFIMSATLQEVLHHPAIFRVGDAASPPSAIVPTGFAALDCELAGGGWPRPGLVELLSDHTGIGELSLLLPAHRALNTVDAVRGGSGMLWVIPPFIPPLIPYAPALVAGGVDLAQLVIVNTVTVADTLWAAEQGLLSGAMGIVTAWLDGHAHDYALRRLSQAARASNTLCVLMRPLAAAERASPAELRIALHVASHGEMMLQLIKRRGLPHGKSLRLATRTLPCLQADRQPRQIPRTVPAAAWLQLPVAPPPANIRTRSFEMDR